MQLTEVKNNKQVSNPSIRKDILDFESMLMKVPGAVFGDSNLCPLKHSFSNGIYVREMFIPKGVVLTGKIHKHEHPYFILKGKVTVVNEFEGKKILKAPCSIISKAGTKRVIVAMEDTILVTVHHNPDNLRDLKKLEDLIVSSNFEDYEKHLKQLPQGNSTNCGLEALKKITSLKTTSMRSLIDVAEDNGTKLYPYAIVDGEALMQIPLPAIVHSENHFDYISKKEDFDFNKEYTGYVLLTKESDYKKIKNSELKNILGETFILVSAAGTLTFLGAAVIGVGAAATSASITAAANSKTKCGSECRAICKKETGAFFGGRKECKRNCKEKCVNASTDLQKVEEIKEIERQEEVEKKVKTYYIIGGVLLVAALGLALYIVLKKKK